MEHIQISIRNQLIGVGDFVMGNTNTNTTSSQWYRCRLSLGSSYGKGSDGGDYSLEMALPSSHSAAKLHIRAIENGVSSGQQLEIMLR